MMWLIFIYIIGCVLAFISFRKTQKYLIEDEWALKDMILLAFITLCSWFTIVSLAIVAIKMYFEEMEGNDD